MTPTKKFEGRIKNWQIHKLSIVKGAVFTGTVECGSNKFEDGWHMRSSLIQQIRKKEDYFEVETQNSIYHLVAPRGDNVVPLRGDAVLGLFY